MHAQAIQMALELDFSVLMQLEQCDNLLDAELFTGLCHY